MASRAPLTQRYGVRDEFLNLDFSDTAQLFDFAEHPFMKRISREVLEPMLQIYLRIREDFSWAADTKTEAEKVFLRQQLRAYLELSVRAMCILSSEFCARV